MKAKWIVRGFGFFLLGIIFVAAFGEIVLHLWNWLMPSVFGLHPITFWQALGIMCLSWILFGRFMGGRSRGHWRGRMRDRWEHMTPEEREQFRQGMRHRCGNFGQSAAEPKT